MKIIRKESKSILTKSNLPESDFVINPYVGCAHACSYCYARFMRRFTGHGNEKWGEFIDIKINAEDLIKKKMKSFKDFSSTILLGSVTDAYQPIEKKTEITRNILKELLKKGCKISVLTKSDLITRDIDLLSEFSNCSVGFSMSFLDDMHRKRFEKRASSIDRRIKALKDVHASGIHTYVFMGPIFPILTPIAEIIDLLHNYTDEFWAESLNLRCGCSSEIENILEKYYPDIKNDLIRKAHDNDYWSETEMEITSLCKKYNVPLVGYYKH